MAKGRSFRSSSKSLMALSSSLGADPGLFFGARDSPLWALSAYRLSEERLTEKVLAPEPWTCRLLPRRLSSAVGLPSNRSCDHVLIGSLSLQRAVRRAWAGVSFGVSRPFRTSQLLGDERYFLCPFGRCGLDPLSRKVSPISGGVPWPPLGPLPRLLCGRASHPIVSGVAFAWPSQKGGSAKLTLPLLPPWRLSKHTPSPNSSSIWSTKKSPI